ncbi:MAG: ParB N-terminal domain-containing protein [Burkholderiales bacterium]|nr:ParB N-terminal domain-containing protein [Anaerolineae bacterium]
MGLAAEERGAEYFSVDSLLEGDVEVDENGESVGDTFAALASPNHPIEASLLYLTELAANIRQHGLINPITVVHRNGVYYLETGERRWLAYHLLHLHYPNEGWDKMPAQVVNKIDRFRQASENMQRNDLNMVARARQYALLLMELLPDVHFEPHDQVQSDRAFYAQALDHRVPRGKMEVLLGAFGLTSRTTFDSYRKVLSVTDEQWIAADDENWPEAAFRELFDASNNSLVKDSKPARNAEKPHPFERQRHSLFKMLLRAKPDEQRDMALALIDELQQLIQNLDEGS